MRDWTVVFRDAILQVAGVVVYDKGHQDCLGRYCIAKAMKTSSGRFLTTQSRRTQRPAAIRFAKKFLSQRAKKAGTLYTPGSGKNTLLYSPILDTKP